MPTPTRRRAGRSSASTSTSRRAPTSTPTRATRHRRALVRRRRRRSSSRHVVAAVDGLQAAASARAPSTSPATATRRRHAPRPARVDRADGDAGRARAGAVRGRHRRRRRRDHDRPRRRRALDDAPASLSARLDRATCATRSASTASSSPTRSTWMRSPSGRGVAGVADAAVRALRAGADLLCLGSNFDAVDDEHGHRPRRRRARRRAARPHAARRQPASASPALRRSPSSGRRHRPRAAAHGWPSVRSCVDGAAADRSRSPSSNAARPATWPASTSAGASPTSSASAAGRSPRSPTSDPIEATCAAELAAGRRHAGRSSSSAMRRAHRGRPTVIEPLVEARPDSVVVVELGWPSDRPLGAVVHSSSPTAPRGRAPRPCSTVSVASTRELVDGRHQYPRPVEGLPERRRRRPRRAISTSPTASSSCSSARRAAASRRCCG